MPRNRYSDGQIERALKRMDESLKKWRWEGQLDVVHLFLVRQMIARRLGFSSLHQLFTGEFASSRAQDDYENNEHFLLKPFIETLWPLISAHRKGNSRKIIDLLRRDSVAFAIDGPNKDRALGVMIDLSKKLIAGLEKLWDAGPIRDVLSYFLEHGLLRMPERLTDQLTRAPRAEQYDEEVYGEEKADWLCDSFFAMNTGELPAYCDFALENTAYSTQHGVKGEEYKKVFVVFDDVEAAWNNYNFTKLLTPETSGAPTEGQRERGRKLAYVCFSRALEDLRVLLFTPDPEKAKKELLDKKLLLNEQIEVLI